MEGKAYLLRPDIPKEGKVRRLKSGETEGGELSDPLKSYADEAGLIMRRSTLTPYTTYALAATEFAKEQGAFDPFHRAMYKHTGRTSRTSVISMSSKVSPRNADLTGICLKTA